MFGSARRYKKVVAIVLMLLHVTGGRVHALTDACDRTRVFVGPSLSFRAIVKAARQETWGWPPNQGSLGQAHPSHSAEELEAVRSSRVAPVAVVSNPPVLVLAAAPRRAPAHAVLASPGDVRPAPYLHSQK